MKIVTKNVPVNMYMCDMCGEKFDKEVYCCQHEKTCAEWCSSKSTLEVGDYVCIIHARGLYKVVGVMKNNLMCRFVYDIKEVREDLSVGSTLSDILLSHLCVYIKGKIIEDAISQAMKLMNRHVYTDTDDIEPKLSIVVNSDYNVEVTVKYTSMVSEKCYVYVDSKK